MPKNIHKLPETYTVSYYNPETEENIDLKLEQLQSIINSSEFKIINQGEVYRSWKIDIDNSPYGPMEFSDNIISQLRGDFPRITIFLENNRTRAIDFLREKGALQDYKFSHHLKLSYGRTSNNDFEFWNDYRNEIEKFLSKLVNNYENLQQFRKVLAEHIYNKHYQKISNWPSVGCENTANVELNASDYYKYGEYSCVVWSCDGWITVKSQRPSYDMFIIEFSGKPEINLSVFNFDRLREIESLMKK